MAQPIKILPYKVNTDLSENYFDPFTAKFLKNVSLDVGATNISGASTEGSNIAVQKPLLANEVYCTLSNVPVGDNFCIGAKAFVQVNRCYVWVLNSNGQNFIYRINGDTRSCDMVYLDKDKTCFQKWKLDPKYFIHEFGCWLEVFTLVDPDTGDELVKEDLFWTDSLSYQGYLRVQDSIDTNGYDPTQFSYFVGDYEKCYLTRVGLPTPKDCIEINEVPVVEQYNTVNTIQVWVNSIAPNTIEVSGSFGASLVAGQPLPFDRVTLASGTVAGSYTVVSSTVTVVGYIIIVAESVVTASNVQTLYTLSRLSTNAGAANNLLFNTWQFRIRDTDVWGRVSEYGIISDMYVSGINDCIGTNANLPSCLNLTFDAGSPVINTKEIAWRNCNGEQWQTEEVIFLYDKSNIGKWWLRGRNTSNPSFTYDATTNKITYTFCRTKECDPIDPNLTNKLEPSLPKKSVAVAKFNTKLGWINNVERFNPFSQSDCLNKISLSVVPAGASNPDTRKITVYAAIYNPYYKNLQHVGKNGNTNYIYGGQGSTNPVKWTALKHQYFNNQQQSGFAGYLVNGASAISTQVYVDTNGNLIDDPNFNGYDLSPMHLTFQKWVFYNVPKGKYIFAISSQTVDPQTDAAYRETSTPMWGLCPFVNNNYNLNVNDRATYPATEILIDCCSGDYDGMKDNKMLVIVDLAVKNLVSQCGYISESDADATKWELLQTISVGVTPVSSIRTDRNGFYWAGVDPQAGGQIVLFAYSKCNRISTGRPMGTGYAMIFQDYKMATFFLNTNIGNTYISSICNTIEIKGRVLLNNSSIGVSNALVAYTRGGSAITDGNGYFTLIVHDNASNRNPYGERKDTIIISGGACNYYAVGGGCIPTIDVVTERCVTCDTRTIIVGTTLVEYKVERGLLSGGTYLPRVTGYDWLGRKTASQPLKPLLIPSIIQSQAIGAPTVSVNIDPSAIFPPEIKYIVFSLTQETTIDKYLSWIVDRVEFIDATNQINNIAPTQIRIYYQSIVEYSALNGYNTTTAWQFIPTGKNTPYTSDKVQFFINGDGKFFTNNIIALVKYDQAGQFFTIDYTSDLANLQQNALIRLIRPKTCTGTEPDFEICSTIDVINQKAATNTFILNAFDTYYLSRQIPVPAPVLTNPTVGSVLQIATTVGNVTTYNAPPTVATVLELRNLGFRFEHNSPSNFWGDGCQNIGRINLKNPYECELEYPNQIALSGVRSINGQLNYLHTYDETGKTNIDMKDNSGIVAAIVENGQVFLITQYDNARVGFNDNLARIDTQGNVQVPSAADNFGKPERKAGDNYGCQLIDKNTIRYRNGLVCFVDRTRAEVLEYNFSQIQSFTRDERLITEGVKMGKHDAAFRAKIKSIQGNPNRYFVGGIDPILDKYYVTDFDLSKPSYINMERTYVPSANETMVFDLKTRDFNGHRSFTPENYAYMDGNLLNVQLLTFKNGVPYSHYNVNQNTRFNTFYGTVCERVIWIVAASPIFKKKKFASLSNYCKQSLYFADLIITEAGQQSALFLDNFDKADFFSYAGLLCDINTPSEGEVLTQPLYEGNQLYGMWISIRLIGEPDFNDKYSEYAGSIVDYATEEKTG